MTNATTPTEYKSQAARDAQAQNYGGPSYWDYLDQHAQELHDYWLANSDPERAELMLTQTLAESLRGNERI